MRWSLTLDSYLLLVPYSTTQSALLRWPVPPTERILVAMAAATPGYAGADLQSLCTGAVLAAVQRIAPCLVDTLDHLPSPLAAVHAQGDAETSDKRNDQTTGRGNEMATVDILRPQHVQHGGAGSIPCGGQPEGADGIAKQARTQEPGSARGQGVFAGGSPVQRELPLQSTRTADQGEHLGKDGIPGDPDLAPRKTAGKDVELLFPIGREEVQATGQFSNRGRIPDNAMQECLSVTAAQPDLALAVEVKPCDWRAALLAAPLPCARRQV